MAILKNNLLFNHTYLNRLTSDNSIDAEIPFSPRDIQQWYSELKTESIGAMVESWIAPMLALLELELYPIGAGEQNAYLLTSTYDNQTPIGLCYVTPPDVNLDTTTKGEFWMAQAVLVARRAEHPLRWVLLTNGDLWRLLDAQALRRYEAFVQIDVGALARGTSDISALRVFYRCFHRSAYEKDEQGKTGLDRLLSESDHATDQAEKHLKDRVSGVDGIMAQLCLGLVRSTCKSKFSEAEREAIYRDATSLLYRMLFLLYAEARELLPINHPNYAKVSMAHLVETARQSQLEGLKHPEGGELWNRLKRLCNAIYESDPELNIPPYNGGLFDDEDHPYLRDGSIADQYSSGALYDLAYLSNSADIQSINYRDLSVRHLGNLYEGMIEYRLFVAEEPMLARRDEKGIIHFLAQTEAGGLRRNDQEIPAGSVYFAQSSGERRVTGTYYTPEYLVDYIVNQTVVQSLKERRAALEEKLKSWQSEISIASSDERIRMQSTVDDELLKFVEEEVLSFTVCDPAMGSGHFLVNAAHNIANFIVETLCLTSWNNLDLDVNIIYWRRRVTERCLFGVDISEMAVELAKLSIWLATMAADKPLSFIDHHLHQGNSLIGARLENLYDQFKDVLPKNLSKREKKLVNAGQLSMFDIPAFSKHFNLATDFLVRISSRAIETLRDVKRQEAEYQFARKELSPFKIFADFIIAMHFERSNLEQELHKLISNIMDGVDIVSNIDNMIFNEVKATTKKWSFFHWDLEFPDVMINSDGFDVIIGNPPYIGHKSGQKQIFQHLRSLSLGKRFNNERMDIFYYFFHLALDLGKPNSSIGFITTNYFITADSAVKLRQDIYDRASVVKVVNFRELKLFESAAGQHNMITILNKNVDDKKASKRCDIISVKRTGSVSNETIYQILFGIDPKTDYYSLEAGKIFEGKQNYIRLYNKESVQGEIIQSVLNKMFKNSYPLGKICALSQGIVTGLDRISRRHVRRVPSLVDSLGQGCYILDHEEAFTLGYSVNVKPWFKNSDVKKYRTNNSNNYWLIYASTDSDIENDIPVYKHLLKYKQAILTRNYDSGELQRAKTLDKWWALSSARKNFNFELPKIVVPQRSKENMFGYNQINWYASADVYFITQKDQSLSLKYILALLNSKLYFVWLYFKGKRKGETLELYLKPLSEIPIKKIPLTYQIPFIERVDKILDLIDDDRGTKNSKIIELEVEIDQLVYQLYGLTKEEIAVVEDKAS